MPEPKHEQSMVGRAFDANGNDLGDATFHERDMGFTREVEIETLARLKDEEISEAVTQVQRFAETDPALGAKAYGHLINLYPDDSRVEEWKRAQEELLRK